MSDQPMGDDTKQQQDQTQTDEPQKCNPANVRYIKLLTREQMLDADTMSLPPDLFTKPAEAEVIPGG